MDLVRDSEGDKTLLKAEKKVQKDKTSWIGSNQLLFLAMVLPGIVFLLVFSYTPMFG